MPGSTRRTPFEDLATADLQLEAVYLGGGSGNVSDDPLQHLVPGTGNQGGFRFAGSPLRRTVRLCVLYSSGEEVDWPDSLDPFTGRFTYYGDNRSHEHELHESPRKGNLLLRDAFAAANGGTKEDRLRVPPFLLFDKVWEGRAVRFRGLLAPGSPRLSSDDELTAIWRSRNGLRFQNYRAIFTVLDEKVVLRSWIKAVLAGESTLSPDCPATWRKWVERSIYKPLTAPPVLVVRKRKEQLPDPQSDPVGHAMLQAIHIHFPQQRATDFEACAVAIWQMIAPDTGNEIDVTPAYRDGGRDAVGLYPLGPPADRIKLEFALEAKCYAQNNGVDVRDMSRLIARLRPRNFGVFVTTSYFMEGAYEEVREDQHPVVLICGRDIVEALKREGLGSVAKVQEWLRANFPPSET
jgi:hypothetical protein